jgi:hypothetical protein
LSFHGFGAPDTATRTLPPPAGIVRAAGSAMCDAFEAFLPSGPVRFEPFARTIDAAKKDDEPRR